LILFRQPQMKTENCPQVPVGCVLPLPLFGVPRLRGSGNSHRRNRLKAELQTIAQTQTEISLAATGTLTTMRAMFSHIVIFWTDQANPNAADECLAGANKLLKNIPGVLQFHAGKMAPSHRPVVEQSYQVALNLIFPDKKAQDDYQVHPQHVEFVEKYVKRLVKKVVVYDFE
jgi:hypothetical protein